MTLGAFSISLSVKDLTTSKLFYEKLGFVVFGGTIEKNYLIMKNGNALVGLFQGMFTGNMLTFNPGWNENAEKVSPFDDVRQIEQYLQENDVAIQQNTGDTKEGPAYITLADPDGNMILIDQHV